MKDLLLPTPSARTALLRSSLVALSWGLASLHAASTTKVYYVTSGGTGSTASPTDTLGRVDLDGTNATVIATAVNGAPSCVAIDGAHNRALIADGFAGINSITAVDLGTHAVSTFATGLPAQPLDIKFDPASGNTYVITSGGSTSTPAPTDALLKIDSAGTVTTIATSIAGAPVGLALDLPNNRAFVSDGFVGVSKIFSVNLTTGASSLLVATPTTPTALQIDSAGGFLYFTTNGGSGATPATADALYRVKLSDSTITTVATAISGNPGDFALDLAGQRALVSDGFSGVNKIVAVDLTNGAVSAFLAGTAATPTGIAIALPAPVITSALTASGTKGTAITPYTITASNSPTSFSATGLPSGLSIDATGKITGTPSVSGSFNVTITAANAGGSSSATLVFSIALPDTTPPTISIGSPSAPITKAGPVTYTVTYADANFNAATLATGNITLNHTGNASAGTITVTGSGATRTVTLSGITGDGDLNISIASGTASDTAGNTAPAVGPSAAFTVDNTAPSISIGSPSASSVSSVTGSASYTVTYADTNFNSSTLAAGDITLNTTGNATGNVAVTGSGLTRTVTLSGITGSGSLGISIATATASDTAGNAAPTAGPSTTFNVVKATATVALGSLSATYDGGAKAATATTTPSGLTVNFTYDGSSAIPVHAGSYTVAGTISNGNYQGSASGTLTISKAPATVTLGSLNTTYNGSPRNATAITTPAGLPVNFTYDGSSTPPTAVGSYTVVGTISETDHQGSATGTLVIANNPPTALAQSVTTPEDTPASIVLTGSDVEASPLTFTVTQAPSHGTLSGTAPNLTYTPVLNYNGPDSLSFKVNDGTVDSNSPAVVSITVSPVNDPPGITGQEAISMPEDSTREIALTDLHVTDVDNTYPTGFTLTVGDGSNYTHSGNLITPAANYFGPLTVPVTVNDGQANSNSFALAVTVTSVNDNPVAVADTVTRFPTQSVKVPIATLLANDTDVDGDTLTFVSAGAAAHGTVSVSGGMVFYLPNEGYLAGDSFTYTISDGKGGTATGTVTVVVSDGSDLPAQNISKVELQQDGAMKVFFNGIPGVTYRIQSSDTLAPASWADRASLPAGPLGTFQFTDPAPLPAQRFYRTVTP